MAGLDHLLHPLFLHSMEMYEGGGRYTRKAGGSFILIRIKQRIRSIITWHLQCLLPGWRDGSIADTQASEGNGPGGTVRRWFYLMARVPVYGTHDAGRKLWKRLRKYLEGKGLQENFSFRSLYNFRDETGEPVLTLGSHVDDLVMPLQIPVHHRRPHPTLSLWKGQAE